MIMLPGPMGPHPFELRPPVMILEQMIRWTQQMQSKEYVKQNRIYLSAKSYLNEYCTIRCGLPRQSGSTTALCYLAHRVFERPLILTKTHHNFDDIKELVTLFGGSTNSVHISSGYQTWRGSRCDGVIADVSMFMNQDTLAEIALPHSQMEETFCLVLA